MNSFENAIPASSGQALCREIFGVLFSHLPTIEEFDASLAEKVKFRLRSLLELPAVGLIPEISLTDGLATALGVVREESRIKSVFGTLLPSKLPGVELRDKIRFDLSPEATDNRLSSMCAVLSAVSDFYMDELRGNNKAVSAMFARLAKRVVALLTQPLNSSVDLPRELLPVGLAVPLAISTPGDVNMGPGSEELFSNYVG